VLWNDLAGADAARAHRAASALASDPGRTVPFLRKHLRPVSPDETRQVERLLRDLNSAHFRVREQATRELERLGSWADVALRKASEGSLSAEARSRLRGILERRAKTSPPPLELRAWRALDVLEQVRTPEARRLLEALAGGAEGARITQAARAAFARLEAPAALPAWAPRLGTPRYSPDGSLLAVGDPDGTVRVCAGATGKDLWKRAEHQSEVVGLVFSPDGKQLASLCKRRVLVLWELARGQVRARILDAFNVRALAVAPDGETVASGGTDNTIRLWSTASAKLRFTLQGHTGTVRSLAFAPSSRLLASVGDDGTVRLWEVPTGKEVLVLPARGDFVPSAVTFSSDGRTLLAAAPFEPTVACRNVLSGRPTRPLTLEGVTLTPAEATLAAGRKVQLRLRAHWSGGQTQDVAALADWERGEDKVVRLGQPGSIEARGPGHAVVRARYLGRVASALIIVPDARARPVANVARKNFVDDLLMARWKQLDVRPPGPSADAKFIRRAYLHLVGTLPTPEEVRRFLANKDPAKRTKLIDDLLAQPAHADYWAIVWGELLDIPRTVSERDARIRLHAWLRQALRDRRSLAAVVRELLTARGKVKDNPAAGFLLAQPSPARMAERTASGLLGGDLSCARCHRHPTEPWRPETYHGLTACFAKLRQTLKPEPRLDLDPAGRWTHPITKAAVPAAAPGQRAFPAAGQQEPRKSLADWLTGPNNLVLARHVVNHCWTHLFGLGLVAPLQDGHPTGAAYHADLLDALARDFAANGYDLRRLLRLLCTSAAYEMESVYLPATETSFLAAPQPLRLDMRLFHRAARTALGLGPPPATIDPSDLADPPLSRISGPAREERVCERHPPDTPVSALFLLGGDGITKLLNERGGTIDRLVKAREITDAMLEDLFWATLSRPPSRDHLQVMRQYLQRRGTKQARQALEDIFFFLLNTREFVFSR
jgi:hypothetical protein